MTDQLAGDADRERVLEGIRDAYAAGRLPLDELGDRIERTLVARTHQELQAVAGDLPVAAERPTQRRLRGAFAMLRSKTVKLSRDEQLSSGPSAIFGRCTVDLRDTWSVSPQLSVVAIFGGVRLVVPPGVTVAVDGGPIVMVTRVGTNRAADLEPVVRVSAHAFLGSVRIITA